METGLVDASGFLGKLTLTNIAITMVTCTVLSVTIAQVCPVHQATTTAVVESRVEPEQTPQPKAADETPPSTKDIYANISQAEYNDRQLIASIQEFSQDVKANPRNANAYLERGWAYYQRGNHPNALRDLNKAIALNPKYSEAWCRRAWIYHDDGKFSKALRDAKKAIRLDRNNVDAYEVQSAAYGALGNDRLAEASGLASIRRQMSH